MVILLLCFLNSIIEVLLIIQFHAADIGCSSVLSIYCSIHFKDSIARTRYIYKCDRCSENIFSGCDFFPPFFSVVFSLLNGFRALSIYWHHREASRKKMCDCLHSNIVLLALMLKASSHQLLLACEMSVCILKSDYSFMSCSKRKHYC